VTLTGVSEQLPEVSASLFSAVVLSSSLAHVLDSLRLVRLGIATQGAQMEKG